MNIEIPDEHLVKVCKYRQQKDTCRYIVYLMSSDAFCCGKHIPDMRRQIEESSDRMVAQGNNCKGLIDETNANSANSVSERNSQESD